MLSKLPSSATDPVNPQKARTGLTRIWYATTYSAAGLHAAWDETAFRQELLLAMVMLPTAFWLGGTWIEVSLLVTTVVIVLIVELLNTGIEVAINRIGLEYHELSKLAKDLGSAAVLLSLLLCSGVWLTALYHRFI
ncbi:MAG: diacylglycerol kinase [Rhodocyclaceae bacterium]|nr:diacylglycerol kinase [Rhodocyclaceae bacterium]